MNKGTREILKRLMCAVFALGMLAGCSKGIGSTETTAEDSQENKFPITVTTGDASDYLISSEGVYTLYSPDKTLAIEISVGEKMSYRVLRTRDGETTEWVRASKMGISVGGAAFFSDVVPVAAAADKVNITYPLYGNQSAVEGRCIRASLDFDEEGKYKLEVCAFDDGVAFRYIVPGKGANLKLSENTTYALRTDLSECWYGMNNQDYEAEIISHKPSEKSSDKITAPLTAVVKGNKGYISLMEAALADNYPGVNLKAEGNATYSTCFYTTPTISSGGMTTGWRLINIADDLNGLVNNYNIYTLNFPTNEDYENTDWIEPGRSAWSWCTTHGAPTPELMREYTIMAAMLGYEYNIIDDGWPSWRSYKQELTDIGDLGKALNVKQLLWGAINAGTTGYNRTPDKASIDRYMKLLEDTGMYGAKMDFWWSEANTNTALLQKYILEEAAKRQFIIDFHGCNKNTGINVIYPNELSREGVHGLEQLGNSNTTNYTTYASWLNAQLYTRYLCGHADWTPATYNAMEIASLICIDSPLMAVASDPADILASPACEFIKSIPTVWDKTVVLSDSKIGTYSLYAKEKDGVWFVGGIASRTKTNATVDLSEFLDKDSGSYTAEVWYDTNGGMESKVISVDGDDKIDIGTISSGRGFAIRISKLSLDRYGGECGTVKVDAPSGSTVKYTLDGSDPMTKNTAKTCQESIEINNSARLRVAITEGDGKGSALSYRFNKISPLFGLSYSVEYGDGKTSVKFEPLEGVTVYYTLDNSTPSESSTVAGEVIEISESCTLKYIAVYGKEQVGGSIEVFVRTDIDIPESDIPLTDAPAASASVGWGNAHYDESMAEDNGLSERLISLGGRDENSGTRFERGISANAVSTFRYNVPENVGRFVAVAGIDDCVWANATDRAKASACLVISFDGVEAYRSQVFHMGEYVIVDVEVPSGAKTMTIQFADAGDGITCDNVSLGAPGWVLAD